jgi:mRNA-degrading endonuclease RelE of RelBE toxin-antitoxin system
VDVQYRRLFLKDLKKLKGQPVYEKVYNLAFFTLPSIETIQSLNQVKPMKGYPNRYRIRVGNYRIGIEINGDVVVMMRVLHRHEFYRYFP